MRAASRAGPRPGLLGNERALIRNSCSSCRVALGYVSRTILKTKNKVKTTGLQQASVPMQTFCFVITASASPAFQCSSFNNAER